MKVRLNTILKDSIVDGPGINTVFVFQGCNRHCPNCHNPGTHSEYAGTQIDLDNIDFAKLITKNTTGITLSGGEPLLQITAIKELSTKAHSLGLTVTLYTGYEKNDIINDFADLLYYLDYIKVGPYIHTLRSSKIPYYGSSNQELYKINKENNSLEVWRDNY